MGTLINRKSLNYKNEATHMSLQRPFSAGNVKALRLSWVVTAVLSLLPMPSYAVVDWTEGYEYANDAAFGAIWEYSCLGNPGISILRPYSGAKSARQVFRGSAGIDPGAGGCFMTRPMNGRSDTVYTRWYMYMENFTVNHIGTKISRHEDTLPGYPGIWWSMPFGVPRLAAGIEGVIRDNGVLDTDVVYADSLVPQNQWVCIETYLSMGTPGVDNGIVRAWINGTQVMNKTNQRMRQAILNQRNGPDVKFGRIKMYTQHGVGTIYIDDYAVSPDARIGCASASIPGDTTRPAQPQILSIK